MRELPPYDDEIQRLLDLSIRDVAIKQQAMKDAWGYGEIRWDADLINGVIKFTGPSMTALAPVQVIGSLIEETGNWLWSWANPTVHQERTRHARLVRHFGRQKGIVQFDTPELTCTAYHAWEFSALAVHLAESHCTYRGLDEQSGIQVFMTFDIPQVFR